MLTLNRIRKEKKKEKMQFSNKMLIQALLFGIIILSILGIWFNKNHEKSVLDIYADQQDAYVQLVLDQINVLPEKTDEEIIENILGSLDTSNRKYWALAKEQTLLFVKDVMETNRYKGFTTPTLFESESAGQFMESLQLNHVTHKIINMEEDMYVASGVVFEYCGSQYKICLLTNETVILDNNDFLSSQISFAIYMGLLLVLILLVSMIAIAGINGRDARLARLQNKAVRLNEELHEIEQELEAMDSYHSRWSLYSRNMMDVFVRRLEKREIRPVVFWEISFADRNQKKQFLEMAQVWLDERILRFRGEEHKIYLMFVQYQPKEAEQAMDNMKQTGFDCGKKISCQQKNQKLWDVYQELFERSGEETEA